MIKEAQLDPTKGWNKMSFSKLWLCDMSKCVNLNDVGIPYFTNNDFPRIFINCANYYHVFCTILLEGILESTS